ncbi:Hsp70 family protein [Modestobacter sp. URMC 112]
MAYRLGIDLGTTYTAAAVEEGGRAEVVQLGDHAPQIPSAVFVREDGELLVGDAAARRGAVQPERMEREFKRRLGDRVPFLLGGRELTAEQLTAELLRTVTSEVQRRQGRPPERIALTHPANWGDHRRGQLLEAVRMAGVGTVSTLTEPAAAAVHYSSTERADVGDVVAVYDLGGGTFDAAVLRKTATEFRLLGAPEGVEQLGGVDFDDIVFRHVLRSLDGAAADLDPDDGAVLAALVRLRRECTEAKEALSTDSEASVPVSLPGAAPTSVRVTRAEFEDMVRPSVERTVRCMERALESARVQPDDVRTVVLVGGSSRIPLVAESLGNAFGRPVTVSTQPKLAVALGAAMLAGGVLPTGPGAVEGRRGSPGNGTAPGHTPSPPPSQPPSPPPSPRPDRARPAETATAARRPTVAQLAGAVAGLLLLAVVVAFGGPSLKDRVPRTEESLASPQPAGTDVTVLGLPWRESLDSKGVDVLGDQFLAGPVRRTAPGGGTVLVQQPDPRAKEVAQWAPLGLALFAAAYTESLLRNVRRRRRARGVDVAGTAGVGAVLGFALVLASWAVFHRDVGWVVLVAVLVLTATAGGLLALLQAAVRQSRRPVQTR